MKEVPSPKTQTTAEVASLTSETNARIQRDLGITEDELAEAKRIGDQYSPEQVGTLLAQFYAEHKEDPHIDYAVLERIETFLGRADAAAPEKDGIMLPEMRIQAALISHNSPYAAVRAVTEIVDDPEIACSTIRSWAIGLLFCAAVVFCNVFFNIRFPSIAVSTGVAQLLAYPLGMLMAQVLPDWGVTVFGIRHSLNPGPFTKKEHMLATLIAQSSPTEPYSYYILWIQVLPFMYNQPWARNFGYQVCLTLSTSMLGYGLSGILRSLVVEPAFCVFPTVLATVGLNKAFHMKQDEQHAVDGPARTRWTLSRLRLFLYAASAMFVYFWLPNYLFPALSMFSWMTWIAPDNKTLSFITGVQSGLGLNPVPTFDWNVVTSITPPLELPFWATANQFLGFLVSPIFVAAMYLTNYQYTGYLPLNSSQMFDRFGERYNMTKILASKGC